MKKEHRNRISLYVFLILAFSVVFGRFLLPRWLTFNCLSILSWDVFGYYLYLPAWFIHHDIGLKDFSWVQQVLDVYRPTIGFYQAYVGPAGDYVMKYTMGIAILYAPFFFIGHLAAGLLGYAQDGFSLPYEIAISLGGLVYAIIGLWFLRKALLRYLPDTIVALAMAVIVLGTNYFQLVAYDGAMSHNYLFMLYAVMIWQTIRWHEHPSWWRSAWLGLLLGLIILIRPTEAISVVIPLLWGVYDRRTLTERWSAIRRHFPKVMLAGLCLFLVGFMQFLYWKIHAGQWLYYSYESEEHLSLRAPNIMKVLFSFKKGWLIYAPLMTFALAGFIPLFKRNKGVFVPVFLFFILNLYLISGWSTWWFGGSLGQRSMMQSYAALAFPMGFFIHWLSGQKKILRWALGIVFLLGIFLNLFQTWQYMNFLIHPSRMTFKYYQAIFLKTHVPPGADRYLEPEENYEKEQLPDGNEYYRRSLMYYDFEAPDPAHPGPWSDHVARSGKYSFRLTKEVPFSPGLRTTFRQLTESENIWIRATGYVWSDYDSTENKGALVITCNHDGENYKYRTVELDKAGLVKGQWNKVTMDYQVPYIPDRDDLLQVYFWYHGDKDLYIDDFEVQLFEGR
jgi:hypothetical protein